MRDSAFRKFHPWVILAYLAAVLAVTMCGRHPVMILLSFLLSFAYSIWLTGGRAWKYSVLCGFSIAVFAVLLMPLFYHNGVTPLFYINGLAVTKECLIYGIMMTLMLLAAMQWFFVWNSLMGEDQILYLIGRAAPGLALLITMSLRFVPLLARRLREIRESQFGLGDRRHRYSLQDAMRDLSVLLSWSLEDSIETSIAMESRGYGLKRRSSFHLFHWRRRDGKALAGIAILFLSVFLLLQTEQLQVYYFPVLRYSKDAGYLFICAFLFVGLAAGPLFYDMMKQFLKKGKEEVTERELQNREREYLEQWYGVHAEAEPERKGKGL